MMTTLALQALIWTTLVLTYVSISIRIHVLVLLSGFFSVQVLENALKVWGLK
jgi:hypothetical protein